MVVRHPKQSNMRILILNWRSIKDPLEGGAERATFEHAKRWVKNHKAKVTWLSPKYDKNIDKETIEGVDFVYIGFSLTRNLFQLLFTFPTFYLLVFWTYITKFKGRVDVVIDQVHGFPYLTPLYVKEKIIVYIHEVAGEIWDIMYPFPINKLGRLLEKTIFIPYKKIIFVGTKIVAEELIKLGVPSKNINTINYGVTAPNIKKIPKKNDYLTVVFLNRLVKMKGPERAIEVFKFIVDKDKNAKLIFIGRGDKGYENTLRQLTKKLNIRKNVMFKGFVSTEDKFKILGKSHVLINTSYKEGWGLVNIEANRVGTPTIGFKVKGNTTTIKDGISGYLFDENDYEKMANKIIELKHNKQIRQTAFESSKQYDWEKVSNRFYEILEQ